MINEGNNLNDIPEDTSNKVLSVPEIKEQNLDLNDLKVVDSFSLSKTDHTKGLFKSLIFSLIAIMIFFVPVTINGETDMVFGIMYGKMMEWTGLVGLWGVTLIILATGIISCYGTYIAKSGKIHDYFDGDSKVHPLLYLLGGFYALAYSLHATTSINMPEIIVGSATGGTVIPDIAVAVFWIIIVGAVTMPFLLNYGLIDFIGSLMEPFMRPVWKVPGRAAVNALASFVSSSSMGVLITNRLYRQGVYTEREAVLVVTGFSAVSVGFAYMVIATAGLSERFLQVYAVSLLITLIVSAIIARIPPFNKKQDIYIDGRQQTSADIDSAKNEGNAFRFGINRASKKALTANPLGKEIFISLKEGLGVVPKVLSLLSAVGVTAMILSETTPIFNIIGKAFEPLLNILQVPDAALIAPSFPIGLAEMFLPVLLIADKIDLISEGARFLVVSVSITQIIFFAETIVTMMSVKLPLKLWELVVVFFERTIIAIVVGSIFMHLMF